MFISPVIQSARKRPYFVDNVYPWERHLKNHLDESYSLTKKQLGAFDARCFSFISSLAVLRVSLSFLGLISTEPNSALFDSVYDKWLITVISAIQTNLFCGASN